ncbi:multidrug efflux RND transporter permease subunit [Vibrio sp. SS-MA-C1-2]|uniref:multidrug efflux RND transporter permease subunit n=1 Tax=Vibrio sp. SS-MA-C1-2 TaxID=2908646 RepID=UPI001F453229|nr:multidrug efflux RND transporter permease subunit [Vibrio sp. SS-MA-C1-2]UJF19870.1 multidrug efflux RND transporter permease subunit [Vibrio sp. SS-MA-C1-2]
MWISDVSVKRPVVAIVLSLLLTVFGYVSFTKLAVREMPDVENPVVSISTRYEGASASIMESQVTQVLEDELTGISGIKDITSVSRNGSSRIIVEFFLNWDLTEGVSDVRDAVARGQRRLPDEADDPVVSKDNGSGEASVYVNLASSEMDRTQLTDYAQRVLVDRFNLINGVSSIDLGGALYKVMYVKLKPEMMAGRGVTVADILSALKSENVENPGGEVRNDSIVMSVRTKRLYANPQDFNYLVVRYASDGSPIYLQDVASVYIGAENENSTFKSNGVNNLSLAVIAQSDANPLTVAAGVRKEVERMQSFLPKGTTLVVDYDATVFIDRSIDEVYKTLLMTAGLVILILYIFLGQLRATLIPAVTVPVSLISAFMAAYFFGFSINLLTLMALILAIGLVVDDAIVVVENIFHHLDRGETPLVAAYKGTREVGFAVVATTFVLVMVFLPISFMEGMVGKLFTEFAVLLAMSVVFSSIIALTLTPVLGSKILRSHSKTKMNAFNRVVEVLFTRLESGYRRVVTVAVKLRYAAPIVIILCIGGSVGLMKMIPSQLAPQEDRSVLLAFIKGAEGTSYNRMVHNMDIVEQRLLPMLGQGVLKSFSIQTPAFGGRAGDQTGYVIMQLEEWENRDINAQQALGLVRKKLAGIPDVMVRPFMPGFRGRSSDPIQFVLSGSDYQELNHWARVLQEDTNHSPIIENADLDYAETTPELVVEVDRQRAAELGVSVEEVAETLEVMLGGRSETTFVERGEEYDVYLRGDEDSFNSVADLSQIYMRTNRGDLISLDSVTKIEEVASATRLSHTFKQKSITLSASIGAGYTLGEALDFLESKAKEQLPADISISYAGESKEYKENQSSILAVFGLALLVAYLVLAAQFESFINPLVVMLTVPMGIFGGFAGLWLTGQGLNIYSQIGMVMLIGMVTKNGILIVEFANQLRDRGIEFEQAIIDASARRLRPILMTAFTTLFGALPLIFSTGAGSESRISVGVVVFSGMAFATLVTLFVIPAMYRLIAAKTHSPGYVEDQLNQQLVQFEKEKNLKKG